MRRFLRPLFMYFLLRFTSTQEISAKCQKHYVEPVTVFVGWSHRISCNVLESSLYNYIDSDTILQSMEESENIVCEIWNQTELLWNISIENYNDLTNNSSHNYLIEDVHDDRAYKFQLVLKHAKSDACLYAEVNLNPIPFEEETCEQFLAKPRNNKFPATLIGDNKILSCAVPASSSLGQPDGRDVDFIWTKNCSSQEVELHLNKPTLMLRSITYDQAGRYVCSARSKSTGLVRHLSVTDICVLPAVKFSSVTLNCHETAVVARENKDATFHCSGSFGGALPKRYDFAYTTPKSPHNFKKCRESLLPNLKVQCIIQPPPKCVLYSPSQIEIRDSIGIQLVIRDVSSDADDFGNYTLLLTADGFDRRIQLMLKKDKVTKLTNQAVVTGSAIAVVCVLLLVLCMALYNAMYIRVMYKRYFGNYETDDKLYGAFVVYNFSQDIDKFSQESVKASMPMVRRKLEEMGYAVYDEKRDGYHTDSRAENLRTSVAKSHRVIILLTTDFIRDGWSMLAFHKGFEETIQTGSKIIFILPPGMKEYLKQHQSTNDECRLIQRAVKLNYSIQWSTKKFNEKKFSLKLEDAMPKLRTSKMNKNQKNKQLQNASNNISLSLSI